MTERVPLSASSVNTFLRCGRQWYYSYVLQLKRPPTLKQARGIALHAAVEINYRQKLETFQDLPISDVTDAYATDFKKEMSEADDPSVRAQLGEFVDSGVKMTRRYQVEVAPSIQPLWVEEPVMFDLAIPQRSGSDVIVPWTGTIDLVDQFDKVRDTKSTGRKPSGSDYALNMTGYALGFRQATGRIENEIVLDYIVATKEPYYFPIRSGGPVSDQDLAAFAATVESVMQGINSGNFAPNGVNSGACSWCGYSGICPAYRKR